MKRRILIVLFVLGAMGLGMAGEAYASATTVAHYRWRNDNGSEAAATWKQAEDTAHTSQNKNENIRLRFSVQTGDTSTHGFNWTIQYATSTSGPWTSVPVTATTEPFEMTTTVYYANGAATTQQLTGGFPWVSGKAVEDPSNSTGGRGSGSTGS